MLLDSVIINYYTATPTIIGNTFSADKKLPPDIDSRAVFANAQLDLIDIDVYGFDYDYTLASYKTSVEDFIHDAAKNVLVTDMKVSSTVSVNTRTCDNKL